MILERGVLSESLVLIRRSKPCTAVLKVGDFVKLKSGGSAVRVLDIQADEITVGLKDWRGRPEAVTLPRVCFRKSRISWLRARF
jgi:hypothetical protein